MSGKKSKVFAPNYGEKLGGTPLQVGGTSTKYSMRALTDEQYSSLMKIIPQDASTDSDLLYLLHECEHRVLGQVSFRTQQLCDALWNLDIKPGLFQRDVIRSLGVQTKGEPATIKRVYEILKENNLTHIMQASQIAQKAAMTIAKLEKSKNKTSKVKVDSAQTRLNSLQTLNLRTLTLPTPKKLYSEQGDQDDVIDLVSSGDEQDSVDGDPKSLLPAQKKAKKSTSKTSTKGGAKGSKKSDATQVPRTPVGTGGTASSGSNATTQTTPKIRPCDVASPDRNHGICDPRKGKICGYYTCDRCEGDGDPMADCCTDVNKCGWYSCKKCKGT